MIGHLLLLACLMLPLGLFVADAVKSHRAALVTGQKQIDAASSIFEQHANNILESYQLVLTLLDEHTRGKTWDEMENSRPLHEYLVQLTHDHPQLDGLAMLDAKGNIRVSSFAVPEPPPNFTDRAYFSELRDNNPSGLVIQRVHSRIDAGDKINMARRRSSADGTFDGALVVNVKPAIAFLDFWASGSPDALTTLVVDDGQFVARYPKPDGDITTMSIQGPWVDQARAGVENYAKVTSPIDNVQRMLMFRKLPEFPVILIHGSTIDAILEPWRADLWRNALLYGSATLGLVVLAGIAISFGNREAAANDQLLQQAADLRIEAHQRLRAEADLENVLFDTVERQEADRKDIARRLHDSLGQQIALLHLNIDAVVRNPADADCVRKRMEQQKTLAIEISQELSRIAWELRPVWLDDIGLDPAIRTFIDVLRERTELTFNLDIELHNRRFSATVEGTVYRALQEAMTNIIKHADASRVDVLLDVFSGRLRLMIEDNGTGFPAHILAAQGSVATPQGGLGLQGMRERLAMIRGSLRIEAEPDNGSALIIDIPV